MSNRLGRLRQKARTFQNSALHDLMGVFGPWLDLADPFGKPERHRLFSPRKNMLAVPGSGAFGGPIL